MDAHGWNGDDNTSADDMTDREHDERDREREEAEGRNSFGTLGGCELHNRVDCERCNLTPAERHELRQAQLIADAIRRATTFSN